MDTEAPHVFQNRSDGYPIEDMYYCATCNGYYGVPHDGDTHRRGHNREYQWPGMPCACRFHTEQRGEQRQGAHGWIVDPMEAQDPGNGETT